MLHVPSNNIGSVVPLYGASSGTPGGSSGQTQDHQAPTYIVGNALAGDTAFMCDYLDPGDGSGIEAALAALGASPGWIHVRRGTYTRPTNAALFSLAAGQTITGDGDNATFIVATAGSATVIPWSTFYLGGAGGRVTDLAVLIPARSPAYPTLTGPVGVFLLNARDLRLQRIKVKIQGAFAAVEYPFGVLHFANAAYFSGYEFDSITFDVTDAIVAGNASNPYAIVGMFDSWVDTAPGVLDGSYTIIEPVITRFHLIGGKCAEGVPEPYYTIGYFFTKLTEFTLLESSFNGVFMGGYASWDPGVDVVSVRGPYIRNCTVRSANDIAATLFVSGFNFDLKQTLGGTLRLRRLELHDVHLYSGASGAHLPGVQVASAVARAGGLRLHNVFAYSEASGTAQALVRISCTDGTVYAPSLDVVEVTPGAEVTAGIELTSAGTGFIYDAKVRGCESDTLIIDGANTVNTIVSNNRVRSVGGYTDTGTGTSISNNIVG